MITPTMEQLALAVLRRDRDSLAAALALADAVSELHREGGVRLPPVHRLTADASRLRVAVFLDGDVWPQLDPADRQRLRDDLQAWLRGDVANVAIFPPGVSRVELCEMPAPAPASPAG